MEFPRQEYWSGLPFPSPGYFPGPGIEPMSPALQVDSLPAGLPYNELNVTIQQTWDILRSTCHLAVGLLENY